MTVIVTSQGKILRFIQGNEEIIKLNTPEGCVALDDPPNQDHYFDFSTGMWVAIPQAPNNHSHYDYALNSWVDSRTLDDAKNIKWEQVKESKRIAETAGFSFKGKIIDSDLKSQQNIISATSLGIPLTWTAKDNSSLELSSEEALELRQALGNHLVQCHQTATALREKITNAESIEEIDNIDISF